jgi:DNA-binding NarL/FixJ family response regulator
MGFRTLLLSQTWIDKCLVAADKDSAMSITRQHRPHLALVDLFVGDESGMDICRSLKQEVPWMKIVLISGSGRTSAAVARSAGASGFISKDASPNSILAALNNVLAGQSAITPRTSETEARLTPRQLDVLRQIAGGASNAEAGSALNLSPHTVKQHTQAVYAKLGVRNRTEAVGHAQRIGLIN